MDLPGLEELESNAIRLKYTREIILNLNNEFSDPSDEFVEFLARQVCPKTEKIMPNTKEKFKKITKESFDQFLEEMIKLTLMSELDTKSMEPTHKTDEWEDYYFLDPSNIIMQGEKSYCPIIHNNKKNTIFRLYFNSKQNYIGFFNNESREEIKISINNINEFLELTNHIKKHRCNVR